MNIEYTGRHFDLDERTRRFAAGKLEKLEKFLDEPIDVHTILEVEKRRQIAELIVRHRHGTLKATEEAEEMFDAINAVVDKVEKQARRSRKKFQDKRRRAQRTVEENRHWPVDVLARDSFGTEAGPRVIKTLSLPIKPMTVEEASLQLEGSKNEFYVFLDSATDQVSVLYRRKDENFGLIAPEI